MMRKISQNRRQVSLDIGVMVHVSSSQCSRWAGLLSIMQLSRLSSFIFLHMVFLSDSSRMLSISKWIPRGTPQATLRSSLGSSYYNPQIVRWTKAVSTQVRDGLPVGDPNQRSIAVDLAHSAVQT